MVKNLTAVIVAVASLVTGAFIASPELQAYAANTVFSIDIVDGEVKTADLAAGAVTMPKLAANSVSSAKIVDGTIVSADLANGAVTSAKVASGAINSAKISDGSVNDADIATDAVRSAEIAANAVGASELAGLSEFSFATCSFTDNETRSPGYNLFFNCKVPGAYTDDNVIVTKNKGSACFPIGSAEITLVDTVEIHSYNLCDYGTNPGTINLSIMLFDIEQLVVP